MDAAVNLDDPTFLQTLHGLYPTSTTSDGAWLDARSHWREFVVHGVERSTPTHADLSVFDKAADGWVRISVAVQPTPPYAITEFALHAGRRPPDVPAPPKLPPRALVAAADAEAATAARQDHFSGVVLIARNNRVLFERAYGLADRATGEPMRVDTKLRIGSMGKMFTTVAILQLAQAGKLDLEAPLGRYLPDYPNPEVAKTVTINELLNHTGGLGDFFGPEFEAHRSELVDPKDYIARFGGRPPLSPPGTQQAYSNLGFIVLGRIVEAVSGEPYFSYVGERIFKPAGMNGAGYLPETVSVPGRAIGYTSAGGKLAPATRDQVIRGTPAGGSYATAPDLFRFAESLMEGRLLAPAYLDLLTKTGVKLPNGMTSFYDFGGRHTADGQLFFGHDGGAPGQSGLLHIFPDNGYIVAVIANRDPPVSERIAAFVEARMP